MSRKEQRALFFRILPPLTNDLLPSLMVEVCQVLEKKRKDYANKVTPVCMN